MTLAALIALLRQVVMDPETGGRTLIAMRPAPEVRWMLMLAAVLSSVVVLYLLPVLTGEAALLPPALALAAMQAGMNVVVAVVIARVGRVFGGVGGFLDALWLMGWLQVVTLGLLVAQLAIVLLLPALNFPVAMAAVGVSIWVLVGFICALHGFRSKVMVLITGFGVFIALTFAVSLVLLMLGFGNA